MTHSAFIGDIDTCKWLIEHGTDVDETDDFSDTALSNAVLTGNLELCRMLLEHGANVNQEADIFETVLGCAVSRENLELCRLLLEYGVNVNTKDLIEDWTVLMEAARAGNADICKLLI